MGSSVFRFGKVGLLLTALAATSSSACGGNAPAAKQETRAIVSLQCDVEDAEVWVDGRYFREVSELRKAFRLRAGEHRIEVRHDRYHSMYYELSVGAGTRHTLRVDLAKRLP
tara:strand:- start:22578 stop:22913 length:336 start_codon:yes stop_codon:yes gene_type:complete